MRELCERAFADAVAAHHAALPGLLDAALDDSGFAKRPRYGVAIGKAALAMARALGPVVDGIAIAPYDDGAPLPAGWRRMVSSHPHVDERALVAGDAVLELVARAPASAVIVALISGGGSALVEVPRISLELFRWYASELMRVGAPIAEINTVRTALSGIKGGQLLAHAVAPVVTLAESDVIGDDLATIASGPTIWRDAHATHVRAAEILRERGASLVLPPPIELPRRDDLARVVVPMASFARRMHARVRELGIEVPFYDDPVTWAIDSYTFCDVGDGLWWGEPTVDLPSDAGEGGRMQHAALCAVPYLRNLDGFALLALGTDGIDGPPPANRPAPAGAYVDWRTNDRMTDPLDAIARFDSGNALHEVGALVITGPTGINHADIVICYTRA